MSVPVWNSTPWPEQRMLLNGWIKEQEQANRQEGEDGESEAPVRSKSTTRDDTGDAAVTAILG